MNLNKKILSIIIFLFLACSTNENLVNHDPNSEMYKLMAKEDLSNLDLTEKYNVIKNKNDLKKNKAEKEFYDKYKTNDFKKIYETRPYTLIYLWEES